MARAGPAKGLQNALPVDKLKTEYLLGPNRGSKAATTSTAQTSISGEQGRPEEACHVPASTAASRPIVLVACGSFNPPTAMHMRMFELAVLELEKRGGRVCGAYMSPVSNAYGKAGLAAGEHRMAMCAAACASSPLVMVSAWEVQQEGYTRTLQVLQYVLSGLRSAMGEKLFGQPEPRVMLLMGADVLASMSIPGVWHNIESIFSEDFGVVCLDRGDTALAALQHGTEAGLSEAEGRGGGDRNLQNMLVRYRENIVLVDVREEEEATPAGSNSEGMTPGAGTSSCDAPVAALAPQGGRYVSSSMVRARLLAGDSLAGLVPDGVEDYMRQHGLYAS